MNADEPPPGGGSSASGAPMAGGLPRSGFAATSLAVTADGGLPAAEAPATSPAVTADGPDAAVVEDRPPLVATDPPAGGQERFRMLLAYDGSVFRGFAENLGVRTVAGELRAALAQVLGTPVDLAVAGRTDAGVHARGQVVSFDAPIGCVEPDRLRKALNSMLAPHIAVRGLEAAPADFHARFSARWRRYRYLVLAAEVPDPFLAATAWWVPDPLDVGRLNAACEPLLGVHDFSSFCRRPRGKQGGSASMVRRVTAAGWTAADHPDGALLTFEITATAFCHQMVRAVTGTLVEVGRGRRTVAQVAGAVAGADRSLAGQLAPPQGLTLWEVGYDDRSP